MGDNLLRNGGFEAEWSEERSHACLVVPDGGEPYDYTRGTIFTPPGWKTWYRYQTGAWAQPEVRDAWVSTRGEIHAARPFLLHSQNEVASGILA